MKRRFCKIAVCITLALLTIPSAFAQFEKANQEYAAGQFNEAIGDYEALVQKHEYSANLFYDLGNAYFRTQNFGKAILNYERALALDSRHPEAEANLRIARDEARALALQPDIAASILRFATANELAIASAIAAWVFLFSVAVLLFSRLRSRRLIGVAVLSLIIASVAAAAVYSIETGNKGAALAIVTAKEIDARVATADNAHRVLALPAGSEIRIVSERGDWIYAALPNNLRGWIPTSGAERVRL